MEGYLNRFCVDLSNPGRTILAKMSLKAACKTGWRATAKDWPMASMAGFDWDIFKMASRRESSAFVRRCFTLNYEIELLDSSDYGGLGKMNSNFGDSLKNCLIYIGGLNTEHTMYSNG